MIEADGEEIVVMLLAPLMGLVGLVFLIAVAILLIHFDSRDRVSDRQRSNRERRGDSA